MSADIAQAPDAWEKPQKILVILAHPDDPEFFCGATLARWSLAGADIVSGSQSHYAMGFQFVGNSLIHFGLGNFLFDQMSYEGVGDNIRREFIDRHIIYNGKYINTELLTAYLMDWAQPNPMDQQKREDFLTEIFHASKLK